MQNKTSLNKDITIREMTLQDISSVLSIERRSFSLPWSYWIFFQELTFPERYYIVAELEGEIVGYAGMSWVLDEGHITTIAVRSEHRRRGIGSLLLKKLIERARKESLSFLTLEVRESNVAAQNLYKKHGFFVEGVRKRYYSRPQEDAIIMTLIL